MPAAFPFELKSGGEGQERHVPDSIPTKVPGLILRFALESDVELILELSEWIVYRLTGPALENLSSRF
jgi:hypothetical protein